MFVSIPAVFYITPYATYIASAKANKIGSPSLVKTFTLDGVKMLHYR
jgi:hypothetical protein